MPGSSVPNPRPYSVFAQPERILFCLVPLSDDKGEMTPLRERGRKYTSAENFLCGEGGL
jgi:hypothetical protein